MPKELDMKQIRKWLDLHHSMVFITSTLWLLGMVIEWAVDASGHAVIAKILGVVWSMACIGLLVGSPVIILMKAKKITLLPWPILLPRFILLSTLICMTFIMAADQLTLLVETLVTALFGCCAFILTIQLSDRWHKLCDNLQKEAVERMAARKRKANPQTPEVTKESSHK